MMIMNEIWEKGIAEAKAWVKSKGHHVPDDEWTYQLSEREHKHYLAALDWGVPQRPRLTDMV